MSGYYDDNYGWWDMDDPDAVEFYKQTQKESVRKKCSGCGRMVKIRPEYVLCNSCADKVERGQDLYY